MIPYYVDDQITLWHGGALDALRGMPDGSVNCVVTSPPYYFIRDYGIPGQYGLEPTPSEYVANITAVMAECLRVLADDGTLWLNVDDVYSQRKAVRRSSHQEGLHGRRGQRPSWRESRVAGLARMSYENVIDGRPVAEKSLMMLPDRIALAMLDDGWILRSKIVWAKTACPPDPGPDRPPGRWEPLLLFSKRRRYWWDPTAAGSNSNVWPLPVSRGVDGHTATFPTELPARCVRLGCPPGGVVLDPFAGSCTSGAAAVAAGRRFIGIDLSGEYLDLALRTRLAQTALIEGGAA